MNTVKKGNKLEKKLYDYLCEQKRRGDDVYGVYSFRRCNIRMKPKYYSKVREGNVEFDVVIELRAEGRVDPHMYVVFECKNYEGNVPESEINDFTQKLGDIFKHSSKGIIVVKSGLQSGAEKSARNRGVGIVKFDESGLDIIADRKGGIYLEREFVEGQIFPKKRNSKSLKFSAFFEGQFLSSVGHLLATLDPEIIKVMELKDRIPFISQEESKRYADEVLRKIGYNGGAVNLEKVCSLLGIYLRILDYKKIDENGEEILGSANFDERTIEIYNSENLNRRRFTIAHEIGHFSFRHDMYLRSDTIVRNDLLIDDGDGLQQNIYKLEYQANMLAANILLPFEVLRLMTYIFMRDIGYRHVLSGIYVDDQDCNLQDYNQLLSRLSREFEVSKQAVEIRLSQLGMLHDHRESNLDADIAY
ncbi:ImmA/IrrE family metallo-endopeptidase [uncultured Cohaesibacter sp.]|uniref:ImmA/IrrE family metallo-endopeptidase n=1 Tax=uncultured Cohaesibacter sp. TaxID=1002546 RepID=UPI0029C65525|nr:ImmA/IrrE family metallo-endopeptidase [uncultured Cohaesibacter sp.]